MRMSHFFEVKGAGGVPYLINLDEVISIHPLVEGSPSKTIDPSWQTEFSYGGGSYSYSIESYEDIKKRIEKLNKKPREKKPPKPRWHIG
jgi:hypothetical protein